MPYYGQRKRVYRGRRHYRRRYVKKVPQQTGYLSTASKALTLASRVASMVNAEKFHIDSNYSAALTTSAVFTPLQLIAEGDDTAQRQGRSVKLAGLLMNFQLQSDGAATNTNVARVMVIIDWWSNGAVPVSSDLLVSNAVTSFRAVDNVNAKRFKVIYDRKFPMNIPSAGGIVRRNIEKYFNVHHHLKFLGSTGVQATTGSGQMYLVVLADNVTINAVTINANFRSYYYDN